MKSILFLSIIAECTKYLLSLKINTQEKKYYWLVYFFIPYIRKQSKMLAVNSITNTEYMYAIIQHTNAFRQDVFAAQPMFDEFI